jgi:branched-chain amino acid transport system ATP-binding protein/branched-chain amino acid transport system permease protein
MPGGIAILLDFNNRRPLEKHRSVTPQTSHLATLNPHQHSQQTLGLENIVLSFGSVRAIDGVTLSVRPGKIHGLIGPNGSGKTTTLNVISGYYSPNEGALKLGSDPLPVGMPHLRAGRGIARTFQTPRIIGEISVLTNVMIGGATKGRTSFLQALLALRQERRERKALRERAMALLQVVGLGALAHIRTDRLQHSELRFIEIARALMIAPDFLMLDEPAAGLSNDEIKKLGELIKAISACGTGVLLVEHHVDLIFDICDDVTVLNLGKILAAGTPDEIRAHKEVVNAYLGG